MFCGSESIMIRVDTTGLIVHFVGLCLYRVLRRPRAAISIPMTEHGHGQNMSLEKSKDWLSSVLYNHLY